MQFELHKSIRYSDKSTAKDFFEASLIYLNHLKRIDFKNNKKLLMYFGNSFFHGAIINKFVAFGNFKCITIEIYRETDLDDLNDFRKEMDLRKVSKMQYIKEPVLYKCSFYNVSNVKVGALFSDGFLNSKIIDTEIDFSKKENLFELAINFENKKEVSFSLEDCRVTIKDSKRILYLTNKLVDKIPYCKECKDKMLTEKRLNQMILHFKEQIKALNHSSNK